MKIKRAIAKYLHKLASILEKENNQKPIPILSVPELVDFSTTNSYEAAWYLSQGASFKKVIEKELSFGQKNKRGFSKQWIIRLSEVPKHAITVYKEGRAQIEVATMARERSRLKKYIRNSLNIKYQKKNE